MAFEHAWHWYCSGHANFHVKQATAIELAQTQITWEKYNYCIKLLSIRNLHNVSSRWQTYKFKVCSTFDGSIRAVRLLRLLQGKGGALDIWPLIFTGCIQFRTTWCTKFVGESLNGTTCMILTKYNNRVQRVIFFG